MLEALQSKQISSIREAKECFELAQRLRCVGATSMNLKSSRSHAIFIITVHNRLTETRSSLFLVDLAGSERIKKSNVSGSSIDETIAINSSLTTLGKCIIALGDKKAAHVPFRESKLTKVLQDALGGKCKTALILTLSPQIDDLEETISSLLFGQRAKKVQCKPVTFEVAKPAGSALVDDLKKQLEIKNQLLQELSSENRKLHSEIQSLLEDSGTKKEEKIKKLEAKMKQMKAEHQTRLEDMDSLLLQQEKEINKLKASVANQQSQQLAENSNPSQKTSFQEVQGLLKDKSPNRNTNKENSSAPASLFEEQVWKKEKDSLQQEIAKLKEQVSKKDSEILHLNDDLAYTKEINEALESDLCLVQEEYEKLREEHEDRPLPARRSQSGSKRKESEEEETENARVPQPIQPEVINFCERCRHCNQDLGEEEEQEAVSKEQDIELAILREELEAFKEKLATANFEQYSATEENIKMAKQVAELGEKEARLLRQVRDLENQLGDYQRTARKADEVEKENAKRMKHLETEVEKYRRKDEENDFRAEGLSNDLAAAEAQLKMSKIKIDELAQVNSKLEASLKQSESESMQRDEAMLEEIERLKRQAAEVNREKKRLGEQLKTETSDKQDLELILDEYRKREQANQTSEQELERLKGVLLESDNWNSVKPIQGNKNNLGQLLLDAQAKVKEYINKVSPPKFDSTLDESSVREYASNSLVDGRKLIKKTVNNIFHQSYFSDFERVILGATSGPQFQDVLVKEYSKARQCLRELSTTFESLLFGLAETELLLRFEEEKAASSNKTIAHFKTTLSSPSLQALKAEFVKVYIRQLRRNRSAVLIQDFFKQIRQKKKLLKLNKRHQSQYERFQAGSGKNMLQMMMKMAEDAFCEIHECIDNDC